MMAYRSPSPTELARLPGMPAAAQVDARYLGDHAIRSYQGRHIADLCRDLGWECGADTVVHIAGGIGTLTMRWSGNERTGTPKIGTVAPRPASEPLIATRRAICAACLDQQDGHCRIAGCVCNGQGQPERQASRCPRGLW